MWVFSFSLGDFIFNPWITCETRMSRRLMTGACFLGTPWDQCSFCCLVSSGPSSRWLGCLHFPEREMKWLRPERASDCLKNTQPWSRSRSLIAHWALSTQHSKNLRRPLLLFISLKPWNVKYKMFHLWKGELCVCVYTMRTKNKAILVFRSNSWIVSCSVMSDSLRPRGL